MLTGQQVGATGRGLFRLPRVYSTDGPGCFPVRHPEYPDPEKGKDTKDLPKKGFTLIEILVSAFIMILLMGSFFMALNLGQIIGPKTSAKVDLQANVRQIVDRITRDSRQTTTYEIANNNPSGIHMKFRLVQGYQSGNFVFSNNYIDYSYNEDTDILIRSIRDQDDNELSKLEYRDITESPFYVVNASNQVVALNGTDLLITTRLVVKISAQSQVRGGNISFTLQAEAKIRNE